MPPLLRRLILAMAVAACGALFIVNAVAARDASGAAARPKVVYVFQDGSGQALTADTALASSDGALEAMNRLVASTVEQQRKTELEKLIADIKTQRQKTEPDKARENTEKEQRDALLLRNLEIALSAAVGLLSAWILSGASFTGRERAAVLALAGAVAGFWLRVS